MIWWLAFLYFSLFSFFSLSLLHLTCLPWGSWSLTTFQRKIFKSEDLKKHLLWFIHFDTLIGLAVYFLLVHNIFAYSIVNALDFYHSQEFLLPAWVELSWTAITCFPPLPTTPGWRNAFSRGSELWCLNKCQHGKYPIVIWISQWKMFTDTP